MARGEGRARGRRGAGPGAGPLSAVLVVTGTLHLVRPQVFDGIVPKVLGRPRPWTIASGVAELVCAAGLAARRTRRPAALATAALLVAVFPANISMARRVLASTRTSRSHRAVSVVRLPLQVPLVAWALRVAEDAR